MKTRVAILICLGFVTLLAWQHRPRKDALTTPTTTAPALPSAGSPGQYPWPLVEADYEPLSRRFPTSPGHARVELPAESWGAWLRHLPLRAPGTPVVNESGGTCLPGFTPQLGAVVDIDLRKNQECADIIYRLRAEWLWLKGKPQKISFRATDGSTLSWADWKHGLRPSYNGRKLTFARSARPDGSRASFDRYLAAVFNWCGTLSLDRDTVPVHPDEFQPGDILVCGGSPGHAVLIVDLAKDPQGNRQALALQGWMPAQSIYVVSPPDQGGWFDLDPSKPIDVPDWGEFEWSDMQRFP